MSKDKSRHIFGSESGVDIAVEQGLIDAYDVLFLSDGRVGWIDKDGNKIINTPGKQVVVQQTPPEDKSLLWVDMSDDDDWSGDEFSYSLIKEAIDIANNAQNTANEKINAANPTGTGSLSINRKNDTVAGEYSVATGYDTIASAKHSIASGIGTISNFQNMTSVGSYNKSDAYYEGNALRSSKTNIGKYISVSYADTYSLVDGLYVLNNPKKSQDIYEMPKGCYFITDWLGGQFIDTSSSKMYYCVEQYNNGYIVFDEYNIITENSDDSGKYICVVGNGVSEDSRSNA